MHAEFGNYLLIFAFFISISLGIFPLTGTFIKNRVLVYSAKPLAILFFIAMLSSFVCLVYAFLVDDFTLKYVAQNSNSLLPNRFKVGAVWGAHEGSFLLWTLIFSGWLVAIALIGKNLPAISYARVLSVMGLIGLGFVSFIIFTSNPFDRMLPFYPIDGADLNPLLQDFGLIIHPPLLYMGYVGFAVSFAFAVSALIEGEWNSTWAKWARPWTTAAWAFLTVGVALGSWWAYYELGWGGWWFWDPSENASVLPWLSGTALMHSLAVTDKRNSFKGWTLVLSLSTFSLSLLGTFLIRSGVLTSVHAFTNDPERGRFILFFMAIVVGSALLLFIFRSSKVKTRVDFSIVSKDMFLLVNNILLIFACFIVFFGTLYPLMADALGRKMSVGPPYFNMLFPIPVVLIFSLLGVGPLLNWKNQDFSKLKNALIQIAVLAVACSALATFFLGAFYWWIFGGLTLALWVALTSFYGLAKFTRHAEGLLNKMSRLTLAHIGMTVAHVGVSVLLVGVLITSYYSVEKDVRMETGQSQQIGDYRFKMIKVENITQDNYQASRGTFEVYKNSIFVTRLYPEKRFYLAGKQIMTEADIDAGITRDLYIALGESLSASGNVWSVRLYVKPFIRWIWSGALLMGLGGLIALSDKRYRKSKEKSARASSDRAADDNQMGTSNAG